MICSRFIGYIPQKNKDGDFNNRLSSKKESDFAEHFALKSQKNNTTSQATFRVLSQVINSKSRQKTQWENQKNMTSEV